MSMALGDFGSDYEDHLRVTRAGTLIYDGKADVQDVPSNRGDATAYMPASVGGFHRGDFAEITWNDGEKQVALLAQRPQRLDDTLYLAFSLEEDMMPDAVVLTVPGTPGAIDAGSGQPLVEPVPTVIYSGPCFLQEHEQTLERDVVRTETVERTPPGDITLVSDAHLLLPPVTDALWLVKDFSVEDVTAQTTKQMLSGNITRQARAVRLERHQTMTRVAVRFEDTGTYT